MKEIKFRAWNTEMKHMVYPSLEFGRDLWPCFYRRITKTETDANGDKAEVVIEMVSVDHIMQDPTFEVMQFTGMQDINGIDIYEGDIVKCNWAKKSQYNPTVIGSKEHKMSLVKENIQYQEVFYSEHVAGFHIAINVEYSEKKYSDMRIITRHMASTFLEVVGNIHYNPELIQKP